MTETDPSPSTLRTLYWLQAGGCGGDTLSLLNADTPSFAEFLSGNGLALLWHPSLSASPPASSEARLRSILDGETSLDLLCVEGSAIGGPDGSGAYHRRNGRPMLELIRGLAQRARFVVAVGTCAAYGGFGVDHEAGSTGLQFHQDRPGGLLGVDFRTASGRPVINLPGCPCHPAIVTGVIETLLADRDLALSPLNTPVTWYGGLIHQGCTRNEYHEYRVEDNDYGGHGCLFFHMGCQAPLTHGQCNNLLWNRRSSKTRVGVPCIGCTQPTFPSEHPFHTTRNIEGIPLDLPEGVDRAHYLAYKGMAAAAAPQRLRRRITRV